MVRGGKVQFRCQVSGGGRAARRPTFRNRCAPARPHFIGSKIQPSAGDNVCVGGWLLVRAASRLRVGAALSRPHSQTAMGRHTVVVECAACHGNSAARGDKRKPPNSTQPIFARLCGRGWWGIVSGGASRGVLRTSPARAEAASSRKGLSDNDLPAGVGVCADFLPGGGDKCRPSSLVSDAPLRWPLAGLMGPVGLGCAKLFPATQAKVANTPTQNCKDPAANKVEKRHTGVYSVGNVHVVELRLLFRPTASGKPFVNQLAVFMPVVGLRFPLLCPGWLIFLSFCATRPRRFARVLFVLFFCLRQ